MKLGTKIVVLAVGSLFVTAAAALLIERSVIRRQGIEQIRDTMRATILSAESTRGEVAAMRGARIFDYKKTRIYRTVPVVAAWESIASVAADEGYEFRIPAHNPRNSNNAPRPDEEHILGALENTQLAEFFEVDDKANEVRYARPIVLSADCLLCHGDPSGSASKNGKDLLGFRMEGWRAGDRHGVFLLRSKLDRVDGVVRAGLRETLLWLSPLSIGVGLGVYFLISKISKKLLVIVETISDASGQVSSAVSQISASSQSLAQGASEQAASLEETTEATERISSMTRKNGDNARLVAEEMKAVDGSIGSSNAALGEMVVSMTEIKDSAGKIAQIIRVIDEIAFQTNILALNAAVEAARAGGAGAGFAVVADEVRSLARRSAQAAKDTAVLIEEAVAKSEAGGLKLEQVAVVMRAITDSAAKVKVLFEEVNHGSREQTRGMEQVAKAVQQMGQVTQSSAANSQENAASSEELAAQAASMDNVARELRDVVEG
jgi:methyl-accepting chemotaxis protein